MLKELCQRAAAVASLCAVIVGAAHANTWYLSGMTFSDGATASGSFEYDATTGLVGAYSLTTTAGPTFSAFTYVPGDSYVNYGWLANNVAWISNAGNRFLALTFISPLTDGGGAVEIRRGGYAASGSWEHVDGLINRDVLYGSISAIPEVETYAMLLAGLGLIGMVARRRLPRAN
jgi:hypothetical protein